MELLFSISSLRAKLLNTLLQAKLIRSLMKTQYSRRNQRSLVLEVMRSLHLDLRSKEVNLINQFVRVCQLNSQHLLQTLMINQNIKFDMVMQFKKQKRLVPFRWTKWQTLGQVSTLFMKLFIKGK